MFDAPVATLLLLACGLVARTDRLLCEARGDVGGTLSGLVSDLGEDAERTPTDMDCDGLSVCA
jgi:hypothetical protein